MGIGPVFAVPKLLDRFSPLVASVVLGVLWWLWHLPTFFIPGTPQYGLSIPAYLVMTTAYSILLTWVWGPTGGSVLVATLVHGMINVPVLRHGRRDRRWVRCGSHWARRPGLALLLRARTPRSVKVPAV